MNGRKARQKRRLQARRAADLAAGTVDPMIGERIQELRVRRDRDLAALHQERTQALNTVIAKFSDKSEAIWDKYHRNVELVRASEDAAKFGIVVASELPS